MQRMRFGGIAQRRNRFAHMLRYWEDDFNPASGEPPPPERS